MEMGPISIRQAMLPPIALCAAMLAVAWVIAKAAGIDGSVLVPAYLPGGASITLMCVLLWIFFYVVTLARAGVDVPLQVTWRKFLSKTELVVLPCLIFPLFLVGYTTAKTAIPHVVGYGWEAFWADADHLIFGVDPWRILHAHATSWLTQSWAFFYTVLWGTGLAFVPPLVAIHGERRFVAVFYTAMMLTWLVGGWLMAYGFSASGPVFAHLVDPTLGVRFAPLRESLNHLLPADSAVLSTQAYLAGAIDSKVAVRGGGISAMPSMHVGTATIYILAARRTLWLWPAVAFWLLTFGGSIYFGYHYAVDGFAAAALAILCWRVSAAYFARLRGEQAMPVATAIA
jgi:hypothetical protein